MWDGPRGPLGSMEADSFANREHREGGARSWMKRCWALHAEPLFIGVCGWAVWAVRLEGSGDVQAPTNGLVRFSGGIVATGSAGFGWASGHSSPDPLGTTGLIKADAAGCRVCRGALVAWGWRRLACGRDGGRWKAAWQDAMGRVRVEERARGAGWACGAQVPETAGAGRVVPRPARASSAAPQRRRRSVVSQLMQGSVMETP